MKRPGATSVVLLVTDPNNAIAGLIQRTRDEGIVEGTPQGRAKLKYIPMLSSVKEGDQVVTSGLVGGFPAGWRSGGLLRSIVKKARYSRRPNSPRKSTSTIWKKYW